MLRPTMSPDGQHAQPQGIGEAAGRKGTRAGKTSPLACDALQFPAGRGGGWRSGDEGFRLSPAAPGYQVQRVGEDVTWLTRVK